MAKALIQNERSNVLPSEITTPVQTPSDLKTSPRSETNTSHAIFLSQTALVIDSLSVLMHMSRSNIGKAYAASADATGSAIRVTWLPARMIFWPAVSETNEMSLFSR